MSKLSTFAFACEYVAIRGESEIEPNHLVRPIGIQAARGEATGVCDERRRHVLGVPARDLVRAEGQG